MTGGSICVYSSRSLQICPLINRNHSGSWYTVGDCERRSPPVSALLRGARCLRGAPPPPRGTLLKRQVSSPLSISSHSGRRRRQWRCDQSRQEELAQHDQGRAEQFLTSIFLTG